MEGHGWLVDGGIPMQAVGGNGGGPVRFAEKTSQNTISADLL